MPCVPGRRSRARMMKFENAKNSPDITAQPRAAASVNAKSQPSIVASLPVPDARPGGITGEVGEVAGRATQRATAGLSGAADDQDGLLVWGVMCHAASRPPSCETHHR